MKRYRVVRIVTEEVEVAALNDVEAHTLAAALAQDRVFPVVEAIGDDGWEQIDAELVSVDEVDHDGEAASA